MRKSTHTADYETFCAVLRQVRTEAGLTQTQLAEQLGWTQTQVSKAELGERRLDLVETRWWCRELGISLPDFAARLERELSGRRSKS
jgi:transcriptional regulator with XRE-family HTH domain